MVWVNVRNPLLRVGAAVSLFTACGANATATPAGALGGPCLDGGCFDSLQCISNLCVDPDDPSAPTGGSGAMPADESSDQGHDQGHDQDSTGGDDSPGAEDSTSAAQTEDDDATTSGAASDEGPASTGPETSDGSVTATSSSETSDDGGGASVCDPIPNENACVACAKSSCCDTFEDCLADGDQDTGCHCAQQCVAQGDPWLTCLTACGINPPPQGSAAVPLGACVFNNCPVCL